ncbi:hypothetical protein PR202_ga18501 [Eleusine coracana subsp. coracana]|uniref:Uncharacterized protein n=1 Tax=Eleusine coracana subsp. coracana TaxID=191504 RepID=A0AAV5CT43_ELECO|nr:hypothetical protein PR202_ga18501 [Eleusine coracana subsp. coracana]
MEVRAASLILIMFHDSKPLGKGITLTGHRSLDKECTIRERFLYGCMKFCAMVYLNYLCDTVFGHLLCGGTLTGTQDLHR